MKLRADPESPDGLVHPPGSFFIGSNKGFLHYPGQPVYCRKCGAQGHVKADCAGQRCRFCGSAGHVATVCPEPKTCSLCGGKDHLFRACPSRQRSYASLFKEGQDLQADFEGLLENASGERDVQKAGPSGVNPTRVLREQAVEESDGNAPERSGRGKEEQQMAPSQVWSEIDVEEVLCGIFGEAEQEIVEPSSSRRQQQEDMQQEDVQMVDTGQGIRRRKLQEESGERERKCSRVQNQGRESRRDLGEEGGEKDFEGECPEGEGEKEKGGSDGVLRKGKAFLSMNMGEGDDGDGRKGEEGEWFEVPVGRGRGKKSLGKSNM